jgi:hypothetical protein
VFFVNTLLFCLWWNVFLRERTQECGYLSKVSIRIDLEGKLAERFIALKEKKGIVNNTELVRLLLTAALKEEGLDHEC